jgi:acyl dehydratase
MVALYFDDIDEGEVRDLGEYEVPKEEMTEFARRYDPQPIHVDEALARDSMFGGVIASGWYTASVCMRLVVDNFLIETASMGAVGLDELTWATPVRPGDTLSVENEVIDTRPSDSREDRGYVRNRTTGYNQDGDEVISWVGVNIIGRK